MRLALKGDRRRSRGVVEPELVLCRGFDLWATFAGLIIGDFFSK